MSDTPRTDKVVSDTPNRPYIDLVSTQYDVMLDHAKTLERELAECKLAVKFLLAYPHIRAHIGSELAGILETAIKDKP